MTLAPTRTRVLVPMAMGAGDGEGEGARECQVFEMLQNVGIVLGGL